MEYFDPISGKVIILPKDTDSIVGGGDASTAEYTACTTEVDGGTSLSVYLPEQKVDGGNA